MQQSFMWVVYLLSLCLAVSAVQLNADSDGNVTHLSTADKHGATGLSQAQDGVASGISMLAHKLVGVPLRYLHFAFPQAAHARGIAPFNPSAAQIVALSGLATTLGMALLVIGGLLALYYFDRVFGLAVQEVLETVDRALIGVDVSFGSVRINPTSGWVKLEEVKVSNPVSGHKYKKDYLLKARRVFVDIDMMKLFTSLGKVVSVQAVELIGVEVLVEKALHSSNVQDVLRGISGKQSAEDAPAKAEEAAKAKPPAVEVAKKDSKGAKQGKQREILLGRIELKDIRVRMELDNFSAVGADLAVADIEYENFSEQVGNYGVDDAFVLILKTILKSVERTMVHNTTVCCSSIVEHCKPSKKPLTPAR